MPRKHTIFALLIGTIALAALALAGAGKDAFVIQNARIHTWNWLMTGKTNTVFRAGSGSGLQLHDQNGFWSAGDIEPVYLWDDGADQAYTRGQKIKPQELTVLQQPGEKNANSKLAPFRVLYGTQLYDSRYRYLISPLLHPEGNMLFPGCDWESIARKGMEAVRGPAVQLPVRIHRHRHLSPDQPWCCPCCRGPGLSGLSRGGGPDQMGYARL